MSLQEITEQILKEAHKKSGAIAQEGETESYRILADAKTKVKGISDLSKKEITARAEAMKKEHNAGVEIERNNLVLLAKGTVVDANSSVVKKGIVSIVMNKHYDKILKKAIGTAKDLTSGAELVIKADKDSQKLLTRMGYKSILSSEKGVVIQTKDGSIKIDASVDSMLSNKEEMIRSKISEAVFSEKATAPKAKASQKAKKPKAQKKAVAKKQKPPKKSKGKRK